jgi:hypothetical protein
MPFRVHFFVEVVMHLHYLLYVMKLFLNFTLQCAISLRRLRTFVLHDLSQVTSLVVVLDAIRLPSVY